MTARTWRDTYWFIDATVPIRPQEGKVLDEAEALLARNVDHTFLMMTSFQQIDRYPEGLRDYLREAILDCAETMRAAAEDAYDTFITLQLWFDINPALDEFLVLAAAQHQHTTTSDTTTERPAA